MHRMEIFLLFFFNIMKAEMPELRQLWREIRSCMNAYGNGLCWLNASASFTGLHSELLYFTLHVAVFTYPGFQTPPLAPLPAAFA